MSGQIEVLLLAQSFSNLLSKLQQMSLHDYVFLLFALGTISGAILVPYCRNVVYSAFALLLTLCSMAGLFIFLSADFLAAVQIMVYAGGVLVLILFGILLTGRPVAGKEKQVGLTQTVLAALVAFGVFYLIAQLIYTPDAFAFGAPAANKETTEDVATLLMTDYLLPFEIISVLLIAVLVGAVTISRSSEER